MKKRGVGLWLLAAVLMFSLTGAPGLAQKKGSFPKPDELRQSNVCLEMNGVVFTSGMTANAQGEPDGNGVGTQQASWSGSGFIVASDGTLLTNAHVARRALGGNAIFADGSKYEISQIKTWDPYNDIAVLKIRGQRTFPAVKLGNSDQVEIMDPVLAVGNTFGEGLQVTDGMINQILADDNNVRYQFKHSANTAPGNSGGAIYRGKEVVAIHFAGTRQYSIHYAVPINLAKPLIAAAKPWLQLADVFSPEAIADKLEQIYTRTGVATASANNNPGGDAVTLEVQPGDDLMIHVQAEQGKHLAAIIADNNGLLGFGNSQPKEDEFLLFSAENVSAIAVGVLNGGKQPCKYALTVYRIKW
jgi:S1-C subfamily serine protease